MLFSVILLALWHHDTNRMPLPSAIPINYYLSWWMADGEANAVVTNVENSVKTFEERATLMNSRLSPLSQ